jgi:hypothetical protein
MEAILSFLAGLAAILLFTVAFVLHCVGESKTAFYLIIAGIILFVYFIKIQNKNGKF